MDAIVVGTDGSHGSEAAVRKVIELAQGSGATIHLVCAFPHAGTLERLGLTSKTDAVNMRGIAADVLARDSRRLEEAGFSVQTHARAGDPADTILDVADEADAELIAVGARGHSGLRRFMLGSVSGKLAHHTPTSLLIVRDD
jgi:nucleotide-binding universal stress UspA family protein